jgi:hypothetical protein
VEISEKATKTASVSEERAVLAEKNEVQGFSQAVLHHDDHASNGSAFVCWK